MVNPEHQLGEMEIVQESRKAHLWMCPWGSKLRGEDLPWMRTAAHNGPGLA